MDELSQFNAPAVDSIVRVAESSVGPKALQRGGVREASEGDELFAVNGIANLVFDADTAIVHRTSD